MSGLGTLSEVMGHRPRPGGRRTRRLTGRDSCGHSSTLPARAPTMPARGTAPARSRPGRGRAAGVTQAQDPVPGGVGIGVLRL